MTDLLPPAADRPLLGSDEAIGVDLQLEAAIAEDALGHDGHHVDIVVPARDNEWCGLIVGIGGAGANPSDEGLARRQQAAFPFPGAEERDHGTPLLLGTRSD